MATKKFMSLERLQEYDTLIKQEIADSVSGKANSSHTHNDLYYTEAEVDTKISGLNTSISNHTGNSSIHVTSDEKTQWNSAYNHSIATHAPSNAERNIVVGIQKNGTDLTVNSSTRKVNITVPTTAAEIGAASSTHNHDGAYDAKGSADSALASAKTYADNAANTVKNDLLNGAGTAYDTLKELGDLIEDNQDAIEALETIASGKADATHSHAISDVSGLQSALDGKAAASHGTHVSFDSTNKPKMDGTAAFGTSSKVARADHVHPTDTSRASQADLDALESVVAGKADSGHSHSVATTSANGFMSTDMVTKLNGIASGANKTTVDSSLSSSSTNPVQNKVVNSAITTLTSTVSTNTNSISSHSTAISNLQTAVSEIQEITSAEIQALFA